MQNLETTEMLIRSRRNLEEVKKEPETEDNSIDCFDFRKRELKVGQWVDVKDTINQWLEAQVVEIRNNKAFIHYNGWGTRWDEWIEMNSPRIALFRTHTVQASASNYLSPFPNSPPDTTQNLLISNPSITSFDNLAKITELSSKTIKMMSQLKLMSNQYEKRIKIQRERIEESKK